MNRSQHPYVDEGERTNRFRRFVELVEGVAQLLDQGAGRPASIVVQTVRQHALFQFGDIVKDLHYRVGIASVY